MTEKLYQVILLPPPEEGAALAEVREDLAETFQVDVAKIETLLDKAPTIIKSGVDRATAELFRDAILRAGGSCEIKEQTPSPIPRPSSHASKTTYPPVDVPESKLLGVLRGFQPQAGLHVTPKIPDKKLKSALERCRVHPMETVVALVDCTVFGSAKNCLLVTNGGIYYSNDAQCATPGGAIPFYELARRELRLEGDFEVGLGKADVLETSGSPMSRERILALLEAIRRLYVE